MQGQKTKKEDAGRKNRNSNPKDRIMEVATRLFRQQGYQATGINQVIAEADVARASLYQHYESKENLCIAFLNRRHDYWFDGLKEFTARAGGAKQRLLASFDFLYSMNEKEDYGGCAFLNILSEITTKDREILAIVQNHKKDVRYYLGDLMPENAAVVKDHIYLIFESAIMESRLFREQWPVTQAKKIVDQLLR